MSFCPLVSVHTETDVLQRRLLTVSQTEETEPQLELHFHPRPIPPTWSVQLKHLLDELAAAKGAFGKLVEGV